jgi:transposase
VTKITRVAIDTSKSVFQLHGVDEGERPVLRKKLRRRDMLPFFTGLEPTRIGLEACTGAHFWARELKALGHDAVLMPPQLIKPYVQRNKNDGRDAEAGCEAMSRPRMRFVPVKSAEQQAAQMLLGVRDRLVRARTQLSNAIRGYAAEFGLVVAKGLKQIEPLLARLAADPKVPVLAKELFAVQGEEYALLKARLQAIETKLMAWHRNNELSRRLATVPGIGPIGASLLAMKVPDPAAFHCGRDLAAWTGLTPKDHSTAGKQRLGTITRAGDEELRRVLVVGAMAVVQRIKRRQGPAMPWLSELVARKPAKLAAVALANKNVRIAWRLMVSGQHYDRRRRAASAQAAGALPPIDGGGASAVGEEKAAIPTPARMTPCSPPSRTLRAASGGGPRGPSLTASARGVSATAQVGTKKRPSGRTKKLTKKPERAGAVAPTEPQAAKASAASLPAGPPA